MLAFVSGSGFDPEVPTAVVCHDAGGAEIVARIARDALRFPLVYAAGPAFQVFKRVMGNGLPIRSDLVQVIASAAQVITGTGWQSDVERRAMAIALTTGVPVAAVLDHWVNYTERFLFEETLLMPTQIWVGDETARDLAESAFPTTPIKAFRNPCFREFREAVLARREQPGVLCSSDALFIGDNVTEFAQAITGSPLGFGFTQFDALRFVINQCQSIDSRLDRIVIRPHPSESLEGYLSVNSLKGVALAPSENSLVDDVAGVGVAFGLYSMALYLASQAGVRSITCLPEHAHGYESLPWGLEALRRAE